MTTTSTRAWASGLSAVGIVVAGLAVASPADAAGAGTTTPVSARTLMVGSVLRDGRPVAAATVRAELWPNSTTLAAMKDGQLVDVQALPAIKADASGRFTVQLPAASLAARYRDAKGQVQVEVHVGDGQHVSMWNFTAVPAAGGTTSPTAWTTAPNLNTGQPLIENAVFDLSAKASVTEVRGASSQALAAGKMAASTAEAAAPALDRASVPLQPATSQAGCSPYAAVGSTMPDRPEPFMHIYPGGHAPVTATQAYGVDHTIGIGFHGAVGSWVGGSGGGTTTLSLGASGSRVYTHNETAYNSINFHDYQTTCGDTQRRPIGVYSILSRMSAAAEPTFPACTIYPSGVWTKNKGTNRTWVNGINVISVNVNAQSGWNSSSTVTWHIVSKSDICGSDPNAGWVSSPEAEGNSF